MLTTDGLNPLGTGNNDNIHYNLHHYHYLNNVNIHGYHHERNKKSLSFMAIICIHFFLDFY